MNILKDIMENGQVTTRAYVGVTADNVSRYPQTGTRIGVYLYEVVERGLADKADLKAGDVITMVDTTTVTTSNGVTSAVGSKSYKAGDTATITYVRDGKVYTTDLTFGSTMDKPQTTTSSSQGGQQTPDTSTSSEGYDYPYGMEEFFRRYFGGMAS